jgi:hypothetical protein
LKLLRELTGGVPDCGIKDTALLKEGTTFHEVELCARKNHVENGAHVPNYDCRHYNSENATPHRSLLTFFIQIETLIVLAD